MEHGSSPHACSYCEWRPWCRGHCISWGAYMCPYIIILVTACSPDIVMEIDVVLNIMNLCQAACNRKSYVICTIYNSKVLVLNSNSLYWLTLEYSPLQTDGTRSSVLCTYSGNTQHSSWLLHWPHIYLNWLHSYTCTCVDSHNNHGTIATCVYIHVHVLPMHSNWVWWLLRPLVLS